MGSCSPCWSHWCANEGSSGGCSSHGMGFLSKLSSICVSKLGSSLMSFLGQDFAVFFASLVSLSVSILCASLPWFAWGSPTSHPTLDLCNGMMKMMMCILHTGDHSKGPIIFRQRVETEVEVCAILDLCDSVFLPFSFSSWQPGVGQLFLLPPSCHYSYWLFERAG